jgi:hypothetical protein
MSNKLIEESTEIKLETHYKTVSIFLPGLVSMIVAMITILIGLFWNHQNISVSKGSWLANANTIIIYTFSLLAWLMVSITLAELSLVIIILSFVIGMLTINGSQRKQDYKSNPYFIGFISVLVPIVTLPSIQEKKFLTEESNSSGHEEIPTISVNLASTISQNEMNAMNATECHYLPESQPLVAQPILREKQKAESLSSKQTSESHLPILSTKRKVSLNEECNDLGHEEIPFISAYLASTLSKNEVATTDSHYLAESLPLVAQPIWTEKQKADRFYSKQTNGSHLPILPAKRKVSLNEESNDLGHEEIPFISAYLASTISKNEVATTDSHYFPESLPLEAQPILTEIQKADRFYFKQTNGSNIPALSAKKKESLNEESNDSDDEIILFNSVNLASTISQNEMEKEITTDCHYLPESLPLESNIIRTEKQVSECLNSNPINGSSLPILSAKKKESLNEESNDLGHEEIPFISACLASTVSQKEVETRTLPSDENSLNTIMSVPEDQEQDPFLSSNSETAFTSPKEMETKTG